MTLISGLLCLKDFWCICGWDVNFLRMNSYKDTGYDIRSPCRSTYYHSLKTYKTSNYLFKTILNLEACRCLVRFVSDSDASLLFHEVTKVQNWSEFGLPVSLWLCGRVLVPQYCWNLGSRSKFIKEAKWVWNLLFMIFQAKKCCFDV